MLILAMSGIVMSSPPPWEKSAPLIYIDNWLNAAEPGENFDVYITAKGVTNLFLAEIRLSFDFSVLEVVDDPFTEGTALEPGIEGINPGDVESYFEKIWVEQVDIFAGATGAWSEVLITSGRPLGVAEGLNGTVQIAKVTFHVKEWTDRTILTIYASQLRDVDGNDIGHNVNDALLENIHPTLTISNFVKPGWRRAPLVPGLQNTLTATVSNTGEESASVRVKFKVTDPLAGITSVDSNIVTIDPGKSATVSATYDVPGIAGDYFIKATVEYEWVEFRWILWEDVESQFLGEGTSKDVPGKGNSIFRVK